MQLVRLVGPASQAWQPPTLLLSQDREDLDGFFDLLLHGCILDAEIVTKSGQGPTSLFKRSDFATFASTSPTRADLLLAALARANSSENSDSIMAFVGRLADPLLQRIGFHDCFISLINSSLHIGGRLLRLLVVPPFVFAI